MSIAILVLGLVIFLGIHSVRIVAEPFRTRIRERLGPNGWRGVYSVISLGGFGLLLYGFGLARRDSSLLWVPPVWGRHLAALLTVPVFILLASVYIPKTRIKAAVKHPMVASVKIWALAHLLVNGRVHDVILFGAFLVWAVFDFRAARKRDRAEAVRYEVGGAFRDVACVALGIVLWGAFAFALHVRLIGVAPFRFTL